MAQRKRSWLSKGDKVEIFEQIRREYEFGVGTIAGVSRKLGVHRRMVREALNSAVPAGSKPQQRRLRKLEAATACIDRILIEDRQAPPKQRHTVSVINERQYRYLLQQIAMRGWRTQEPRQFDIPLERPRLIRQMAEYVYGQPLDYASIASDAHLSSEHVRSILERYASSAETQMPQLPSNVMRFPYSIER